MDTEKVMCSASVYGTGRWDSFHPHGCAKRATVTRDGRPYCGTHDPAKVAERNTKLEAKWREEAKVRQENWRRERLVKEICDGVGADTLEALGKGWLNRHLSIAADETQTIERMKCMITGRHFSPEHVAELIALLKCSEIINGAKEQ